MGRLTGCSSFLNSRMFFVDIYSSLHSAGRDIGDLFRSNQSINRSVCAHQTFRITQSRWYQIISVETLGDWEGSGTVLVSFVVCGSQKSCKVFSWAYTVMLYDAMVCVERSGAASFPNTWTFCSSVSNIGAHSLASPNTIRHGALKCFLGFVI